MPELPEVETVVQGLVPHMEGAAFERVKLNRANLRFPFPKSFASRLQGMSITRIKRRAKYILCYLSSGDVLVMHLGMSGKFIINDSGGEKRDIKHRHVIFSLKNGDVIEYHDPRRFGFMTLIAEEDLQSHAFFKDLGPEPLGNEFNEDYLADKAKAKKTPLKSFLLDQKIIAGLGNIYVLEALYRARLLPKRAAGCLAGKSGKPLKKTQVLTHAIRTVLQEAIQSGGSSLKDYAKTDGSLGYFQHRFQVYGRTGEPCLRRGCAGVIKRINQSGRSSFYCPKCQK